MYNFGVQRRKTRRPPTIESKKRVFTGWKMRAEWAGGMRGLGSTRQEGTQRDKQSL